MSDYMVHDLDRGVDGAPCRCNGYADKLDAGPTAEEIKEHDCGRSYACCTGAFKCRLCGLRFIATFKAPEMGL
jgi:hypothetical protein